MNDLKLLQYHFLFSILSYGVADLEVLHLKCYVESFYIEIILKQNKFAQFLVKKSKMFCYASSTIKNIVALLSNDKTKSLFTPRKLG